MRERQLSFHARYRCQDSGDCCTAGWPITIEPDRLALAERALEEGKLRPATAASLVFVRAGTSPVLLATPGGACVFYRRDGHRRCEVHRALGPGALPVACRRFPRCSIVDPGGVSTSLSSFCPTVRMLLEEDESVEVVGREIDLDLDNTRVPDFGLDMRDSVPPLLRPAMFMDWESWWLFEELSIRLLQRSPARDGLQRLGTAVDVLRRWAPTDGPLRRQVERAFATALDGSTMPIARTLPPQEHLALVLNAIPPPFRPTPDSLAGDAPSVAVGRRLVMSHALANWTAHLGHGLRTWLRSLQAVEGLLSLGLGAREVDLLIRHLADPSALAQAWSDAERD